MMIKRHLFFNNKYSSYAKSSSSAAPDNFARTYGTVIPSRIPESSAWWPASGKTYTLLICFETCTGRVSGAAFAFNITPRKVQSKELASITDDAESGARPLLARMHS